MYSEATLLSVHENLEHVFLEQNFCFSLQENMVNFGFFFFFLV